MPKRLAAVVVLATAACAPHAAGPGLSRADSTRVQQIAPGISYQYHWYRKGPWAVHTITVDPRACGIEFRSLKAGDHVTGRETTSGMAQRAAQRFGRPVLAGVNADFFSFTPPGITEGPQVANGQPLKSEGVRREALSDKLLRRQPVFALTTDGRRFLTFAHFRGVATIDGQRVPLAGFNVPVRNDSAFLFSSFWSDTIPSGRYVVVSRGKSTVLPPAQVSLSFDSVPGNVTELVGGYPMLLRNGRAVYDQEGGVIATFGEGRHARTAIGWGNDRSITLIVVDGRRPKYSEGMSLQELANYLRSLGITEAMNFDGGGSSTMVLQAAVANLPSDSTDERRVANSLLVLGPRPGQCRR